MSTTTTVGAAVGGTVEAGARRTPRPAPARIPLSRIVAVEARKSFDTRSGFWLMASIAIMAVLATAATILFAPDDQLTYEAFATAVGFPMAIILPMVAILSVTGEWSQRTGLTSFTLVPHRGRVIAAKALVALIVGVVSMLLAAAIGALGNVVGTAITGTDTVWNVSATELAYIILANILGMAVGFMLGVLVRNSPAAIVGYFVYSLVLPTISGVLAQTQDWFADKRAWVDFNFAQGSLFDGGMSGTDWAQLGVTGLIWLVLPLTIGLWAVLRSEVK
jgi:ABC-type transport system involved in multi-copper enzyme maturation permease subunit